MDSTNLQILFSDIINGYTFVEHQKWGEFYIKHFNNFEVSELEKLKNKHIEKSKKEGIPTIKEKEIEIIKEGYWTEKKNSDIRNTELFIQNLKQTKSKLTWENQIKEIQKELSHEERKLFLLRNEKTRLLGITAESISNKKLNEFYIFKALYKDKNLNQKFFSKNEFDDLEDQHLNELVEIYNNETNDLTDKNIQKIALSPFFLNLFITCGDNPYVFFGKFIIHLTFYQISLFNEGKRFKDIIQNSEIKPPQELYNDPEEFLNWVDRRKNAEELLAKGIKTSNQEGATNIIFGAKKEELNKLGYNTKDFKTEAKKMGKESLDMEDMMKITL